MPPQVYEVVAQGARYWFLFLMALIAWRSWRWYRKDQKQAKKRRKLLPDAGFVGEMVVLESAGALKAGDVLPVPNEGTLGSLRTNDLCVQAPGVAKRHLWFRFEERKGLLVEPLGKGAVQVDGSAYSRREGALVMLHGSRLAVGDCVMRLRLFAGFESIGYASRQAGVEDVPPENQAQAYGQAQPLTQEQLAAWQQQWMQQQMTAMQQAYQAGYEQAVQHWAEEEEAEDEESLPYEMAQIAQEEGMVDHRMFMRPEGHGKPEVPAYEPELPQQTEAEPEEGFYPPEMDGDWMEEDEDWSAFDEDMTDAAAPPKSAYVGRDESERAKKQLWDKYFGGGGAR